MYLRTSSDNRVQSKSTAPYRGIANTNYSLWRMRKSVDAPVRRFQSKSIKINDKANVSINNNNFTLKSNKQKNARKKHIGKIKCVYIFASNCRVLVTRVSRHANKTEQIHRPRVKDTMRAQALCVCALSFLRCEHTQTYASSLN